MFQTATTHLNEDKDTEIMAATKALHKQSLFSLVRRPKADKGSMCMTQLFNNLGNEEDDTSEMFPSIEWPDDDDAHMPIFSGSRQRETDLNGFLPKEVVDAAVHPSEKRRRSYDELQETLKHRILRIKKAQKPNFQHRQSFLKHFSLRRTLQAKEPRVKSSSSHSLDD
jgi:hypothetical protein